MVIDKSNEVLMNYYRKQEIIKANERIKEGISIVRVLQLADKEFITTDELLEALYISKEQVLDEFLNTPSVTENTIDVLTNTTNVSNDTPMVLAKKYMDYYELYNHDRKKICKEISNFTW